MKILGYIPTSFSDWEGRLVAVLFVGGCNYRCPFCQNYPLLDSESPVKETPWREIGASLKGRRDWIDGVVISGGEPLMHPEIFDLCRAIRDLGFAVKIDTNGSFPFVLMKLIKEELVSSVAMDIKTALDERYHKACGVKVELGLILRTLRLLLTGPLDYEFRTTLVPGLVGEEEIAAIVERIRGARRYALQQYVPENVRTEAWRRRKPMSRPAIDRLAAIARPHVEKLILRGRIPDE